LHLSKRGKRAGLVDTKTGNAITSFNIEHSQHGIAWQLATGTKAEASKAKAKNLKARSMVRDLIVDKGTITRDAIKAWALTT
jgi:hypothetical protein